jgi:hypothetical protein
MKKVFGLVVLTLCFSFNHLTFAQECYSTCRCRQSYEVLDYGCQWTTDSCGTSGGQFPNCNLLGSHCCYFENGICESGYCAGFFTFRQCYLDSCNYT